MPGSQPRAVTLEMDARSGPERIDAVYLWVDGADPCFQQKLAFHAARHGRYSGR